VRLYIIEPTFAHYFIKHRSIKAKNDISKNINIGQNLTVHKVSQQCIKMNASCEKWKIHDDKNPALEKSSP